MSSDYVIVGAGLSGTVLGVRLSEDPSITVMILEASSTPFHTDNIDVPGKALRKAGIDRYSPETPWQLSCLSSYVTFKLFILQDGAIINIGCSGKSIGGSTLLNFMQYNRAAAVEYDALEKKLGTEGWNWDNLLPYFKKLQTLNCTEEYAAKFRQKFDPKFHGNGSLQTHIPKYVSPVTMPWIKTVKRQGIKHNPDLVTGDITGAWVNIATLDNKSVRSTSGSAYYKPNQSHSNLKVISGTLATKVLTSGSEPVVTTEVEYLKDGTLHTIKATKEVILSAGSYKTVQILELSDAQALCQFVELLMQGQVSAILRS
ncbi:Choline dehydrogenase, mitochondrial [Leucoagaricus sp. SymC.cos]|nr:Choline dehydrogenase, mitochondrial [Leucoagaricus sp. SymC.cos]